MWIADDGQVGQIGERAMHKDRALRFPTWDAFSAALSAASQTGPGDEVGGTFEHALDPAKVEALWARPPLRCETVC